MGRYVSIRHNGSLAQAPTGWLFLGILLAASALLAAVWLQPWVPVAYLVRDPLVVANQAGKCCSFYYGAVSNLGVVLWIAAAAVCLFTALIAHAAQAERSRTLFFLAAGLFTLWLGLDDFFLIHDDVLPHFGVPETVTYAAYAAMAAAYLAASWRLILAGRPFLFLAAGSALAASMGLDAFVHSEAPLAIMAEDGLKFLGIALWAGFHVTAAATLAEELAAGRVTTVAVSSPRLIRRLA
jgi:hypothetical protein